MMMLRSPVLRAFRLISRNVYSAGSSLDKSYLDPYKHIYMNHFPHLVYVEYWPVGQYPDTYLINSVSPKTYQPQVENILVESLNARYNKTFKIQQIIDRNLGKFFSQVLKSQQKPQNFLHELLANLAKNIYVKESAWTWVKEQEIRSTHVNHLTQNASDLTFREFLTSYNLAIEQLVLISNFGFSGKIQQQQTAQQKHFYYQLNTDVEGIQQLKDTRRPQNNNLINKLMSTLHSL